MKGSYFYDLEILNIGHFLVCIRLIQLCSVVNMKFNNKVTPARKTSMDLIKSLIKDSVSDLKTELLECKNLLKKQNYIILRNRDEIINLKLSLKHLHSVIMNSLKTHENVCPETIKHKKSFTMLQNNNENVSINHSMPELPSVATTETMETADHESKSENAVTIARRKPKYKIGLEKNPVQKENQPLKTVLKSTRFDLNRLPPLDLESKTKNVVDYLNKIQPDFICEKHNIKCADCYCNTFKSFKVV